MTPARAGAETPAAFRVVSAAHGLREVTADPDFEKGLAAHLREHHTSDDLLVMYQRFAHGDIGIDPLMRRVLWHALARRIGNGLQVGSGVEFKHIETFEIGDGVLIGTQAFIQGRFDGICRIGDRAWIGPGAFLDARNLVLGEYVGWGPGAKVLGSEHTARPADVPIIQTDLEIKAVIVDSWADVGTNAVVLPGVTIGRGSIVGAGAVVTRDVPPFAVVAGVPAEFLYWRDGRPERETIS